MNEPILNSVIICRKTAVVATSCHQLHGSAVQGPLWCCVCIINSYSALLNWPIVSLLILFILFSMFFVLIHDYTPCFTGYPCCNFIYYNYISLWLYYIFIHSISMGEMNNNVVHLTDIWYATWRYAFGSLYFENDSPSCCVWVERA